MSRHRTQNSSRGEMSVEVDLTRVDIDVMIALANYYERSMGPMRHIVRLTARREIRARFRFLADESKWLKQFAVASRDDLDAQRTDHMPTTVTARALIAFWGRLLAAQGSRRATRKLSPQQIKEREDLATKLQSAAGTLAARNRARVEEEIRTRRPAEADQMRKALGLGIAPPG